MYWFGLSSNVTATRSNRPDHLDVERQARGRETVPAFIDNAEVTG